MARFVSTQSSHLLDDVPPHAPRPALGVLVLGRGWSGADDSGGGDVTPQKHQTLALRMKEEARVKAAALSVNRP